MKKLCECGCEQVVTTQSARFIKGHNFRLPIPIESEQKRREKISKWAKHHFNQPEIKEKTRQYSTGRKHSEETKKKLSKLRSGRGNGMFGKKLSKEVKAKIVASRKWYKHSEETKKKISLRHKGQTIFPQQRQQISKTLCQYYTTHPNPFKNKHHSPESIEKMNKNLKGKYKGEKASNWKGGISALPYALVYTGRLIEAIRKRDEYKCQNPTCTNPHPMLDVHHIDYDKQNCHPLNLITICKRCHGKTQHNREYWVKYYVNINKKRIKQKMFRTKY